MELLRGFGSVPEKYNVHSTWNNAQKLITNSLGPGQCNFLVVVVYQEGFSLSQLMNILSNMICTLFSCAMKFRLKGPEIMWENC